MPSGDWEHSDRSPADGGNRVPNPPQPRWLRRVALLVARLPVLLAVGLVQIYRALISPLLPPSCRYLPTCSEYMVGALRIHGFWRGLFLGTRRLLRCHPGHPGGFDPVPERRG